MPPSTSVTLRAEAEQPQLELRPKHAHNTGNGASCNVLDYGVLVGGASGRCSLELINKGQAELPLEITIINDVSLPLLLFYSFQFTKTCFSFSLVFYADLGFFQILQFPLCSSLPPPLLPSLPTPTRQPVLHPPSQHLVECHASHPLIRDLLRCTTATQHLRSDQASDIALDLTCTGPLHWVEAG